MNSAHLGGVVSVVAILIIVIAVLLCFMLLVYSRKKFPKRGKFTVNNEAPSNGKFVIPFRGVRRR